jgi:hypothetical protein
MADVRFSCPGCGQTLEASEDMTGEAVECPSCAELIEVPAPEGANPDDAFDGEEAGGDARGWSATDLGEDDGSCPECGTDMEPDAVLCIQCGFHKGLGRRLSTDIR